MSGQIEITDCENDVISESIAGYLGSKIYNLFLPNMDVDLASVAVQEETFDISFTEGWNIIGFPFDLSTITKIEYLNNSGVVQSTQVNPTLLPVYIYSKEGTHIQKRTSSNAGLISSGYTEEVHQTISAATLFAGPNNDNKLLIAKDYLGSAYLPQYNFDGIGLIQKYESIQCKLTDPLILRVTAKRNHIIITEANGSQGILYGSYVRLWPGWSLMNWPCKHPADCALTLLSVVEDVVILKNSNGSTYLPQWNFNGIPDFIPGQGYQIKIEDNKTNYFFIAENE